MGASWEVDEKNLISSDKCLCGQGTIDYYEVKLSHTKVIREKTEHETEINCPNPECPSKKPKSLPCSSESPNNLTAFNSTGQQTTSPNIASTPKAARYP